MRPGSLSSLYLARQPSRSLIASGSRGVLRSFDWGQTWTQLRLWMGQVDEIAGDLRGFEPHMGGT